MTFKNNKKADLLSIWWFFMIVVIVVGIVIGTLLFTSRKIDMRVVESDILASRTLDCITNIGKVNSDFTAGNFDIYSKCGFNKQVVNDSRNYFLKITVSDKATNQVIKEISYGNNAFEADCQIPGIVTAEKYPRCVTKESTLLDSSNKPVEVVVIAASNTDYRLK
jgi:hypothetical protein